MLWDTEGFANCLSRRWIWVRDISCCFYVFEKLNYQEVKLDFIVTDKGILRHDLCFSDDWLLGLFVHYDRVILQICDKVEDSIKQQRFLSEFKMNGLPLLSDKLDKFLTLIVSLSFYATPISKFPPSVISVVLNASWDLFVLSQVSENKDYENIDLRL